MADKHDPDMTRPRADCHEPRNPARWEIKRLLVNEPWPPRDDKGGLEEQPDRGGPRHPRRAPLTPRRNDDHPND